MRVAPRCLLAGQWVCRPMGLPANGFHSVTAICRPAGRATPAPARWHAFRTWFANSRRTRQELPRAPLFRGGSGPMWISCLLSWQTSHNAHNAVQMSSVPDTYQHGLSIPQPLGTPACRLFVAYSVFDLISFLTLFSCCLLPASLPGPERADGAYQQPRPWN